MFPNVLFICKRRPTNYGPSYGLINSCRFLCNALKSLGVNAALVEVIDNNGIEREVVKFKATHVFIEALWVVPEKFDVLIKLHPHIQWFVRLHSNTPFIANEGIAMNWIIGYANQQKKYPQFHIAPNNKKFVHDLELALDVPTVYAPNIYCPDIYVPSLLGMKDDSVINIAGFGAIRPLKNQLIQAMAAMRFANEKNKTLKFHINVSRLEQRGENVHKNIKSLFEGSRHILVEHGWLAHEEFVALIKQMDMGLQVSFSETFNIVAADFVSNDIPVIVSKEIEWVNWLYQANPTDIDSILYHMDLAYWGRKFGLQKINKWGLRTHNMESLDVWRKLLKV